MADTILVELGTAVDVVAPEFIEPLSVPLGDADVTVNTVDGIVTSTLGNQEMMDTALVVTQTASVDKEPMEAALATVESQTEQAVPEVDENCGPGEAVIGKTLKKKFEKRFYYGKLQSWDEEEKWYHVVYEDGDEEDLYWMELEPLLLSGIEEQKAIKKPFYSNKPPRKRSKPQSGTEVSKKQKFSLEADQVDLGDAERQQGEVFDQEMPPVPEATDTDGMTQAGKDDGKQTSDQVKSASNSNKSKELATRKSPNSLKSQKSTSKEKSNPTSGGGRRSRQNAEKSVPIPAAISDAKATQGRPKASQGRPVEPQNETVAKKSLEDRPSIVFVEEASTFHQVSLGTPSSGANRLSPNDATTEQITPMESPTKQAAGQPKKSPTSHGTPTKSPPWRAAGRPKPTNQVTPTKSPAHRAAGRSKSAHIKQVPPAKKQLAGRPQKAPDVQVTASKSLANQVTPAKSPIKQAAGKLQVEPSKQATPEKSPAIRAAGRPKATPATQVSPLKSPPKRAAGRPMKATPPKLGTGGTNGRFSAPPLREPAEKEVDCASRVASKAAAPMPEPASVSGSQPEEAAATGESLVGTKIVKQFDGKSYSGEVVTFSSKSSFYRIAYEDGDEEDLEWVELVALIASNRSRSQGSPSQTLDKKAGRLPHAGSTARSKVKQKRKAGSVGGSPAQSTRSQTRG